MGRTKLYGTSTKREVIMKDETVTSIVHHHIKKNEMDNFQIWLKRAREESLKFDGFIDSKLIESIGIDREVISIFRFENYVSLNKWLKSKKHGELLTELKSITEKEVQINSYSGLEFWFVRSAPNKLTMMVMTFFGLLPLVLLVPPLIEKITNLHGPILVTISTAVIVVLMTYFAMPLLIKLKILLNK